MKLQIVEPSTQRFVVSAIVVCSTVRESTILESLDSKTSAIVTPFAPDKIFVWNAFYFSLFLVYECTLIETMKYYLGYLIVFFKDLPYENCRWWFLKVLHYWRHLVERKMWSDVKYTPTYSLGICDRGHAKKCYTSLNLLNFFRALFR